MTPETLFGLANQIALVGWLILVFGPRRYDWLFFVPQYIIPFALGLGYGGLMFVNFFSVEGGGYSTLDSVRALFENPHVLVAGWVHYLAFDLFVGAWIARQADALGITRLIQIPILLATFLFGPVGLVLFLVFKAAHGAAALRAAREGRP
ncbi:MAG: ABA4-like family protein [Alphaproteobacteria bacterium]